MAGEGKRFTQVGIDLPKYAIKARKKTLFEWSMISLKNFYNNNFIFIVKKDQNATSYIRKKASLMGINNISFLEIDKTTKGQAETAVLAEKLVNDIDDPILIYNIDTYVHPSQLKQKYIKGDGWIPSFEADGYRWSFVDFDENFKVRKVTEKIKISNYGTIGLYYFSSFNLYKKIYEEYPFNKNEERYIAPMYNHVIARTDMEVYTRLIDKNAVHVLGTPKDLEKFDANWMIHNQGVDKYGK